LANLNESIIFSADFCGPVLRIDLLLRHGDTGGQTNVGMLERVCRKVPLCLSGKFS